MKNLHLIGMCLAVLFSTPAAARGLVDCPMRDAPFSLASPLMDILISPAAAAAVERNAPNLLTGLPPVFTGTTVPSLSAAMTLRDAATFGNMAPEDLAGVASALSALPVSHADKVARCARYDTKTPRLAIPAGRPRVLLFEKITGFRDDASVAAAHAAFLDIARRKGWAIVTTDSGAAFTPALLRKFDAVIWNNISGDALTLSQRRAFKDYMEKGGGFVGVHGAGGDPAYFWDWYADTLLGARFAGHTVVMQRHPATLKIDDAAHPIAQGLPAQWQMDDEWYSFSPNPRAGGARIVATLDETTYDPTGLPHWQLRMGDHPIAWTRCVNRGRMFYSAIGHMPKHYSDPIHVQMLEQAVAWSAGLDGDACPPSK